MTQDLTISELEERKDSLTEADLNNLLQDEREGARKFAQRVLDERRVPEVVPVEEYDPRLDPGPLRREDDPKLFPFVGTPTDTHEVDLESQRKDETSVLATDRFNLEGHRVNLGK